jgi:hypothetical protein
MSPNDSNFGCIRIKANITLPDSVTPGFVHFDADLISGFHSYCEVRSNPTFDGVPAKMIAPVRNFIAAAAAR